MALDATLKKQLLDARENIIAQLNATQFPTTPGGIPRRGAGPAYDYAYVELQQELREIDELLGYEEGDQDDDISTEIPLPTSFTRSRQPDWNLALAGPALVAMVGAVLAVLIVLLRTLMTS
jgi:hypothetical protein